MAEIIQLSADKRSRLLEFLGGLPDATAARLFAALERDRARGGKGLPHDTLIDALRRQLLAHEATFPTRTPTAQRAFFTPFEDFFIARRAGPKRRARIARTSIAPVWALILDDPACGAAGRAAAALDRAIVDGSANVETFAETLFAAAGDGFGRLLAHARSDAGFRGALAERLGGDGALEDLAEMHLLLGAVDRLRAVQAAFPKPVAALTEEELFELRRLYGEARESAPDAAPYLLLALMGRMETPWRALPAYYHLSRADPEDERARVIIDTLFEDLEEAARGLERDADSALNADEASFRVRHFADFAQGVADEARRAGDNVSVNRVEACRDIAGACIARFTEQSLAALRRALPTRHAGGASRLMGLRPDYDRAPSQKTADAAREAALFLAGAVDVAHRLERAPAAEGVVADAVDEARRYLADLVVEIRAAEGEDRGRARRLMDHALALAGPLLPADEIALFKERARAAALTA